MNRVGDTLGILLSFICLRFVHYTEKPKLVNIYRYSHPRPLPITKLDADAFLYELGKISLLSISEHLLCFSWRYGPGIIFLVRYFTFPIVCATWVVFCTFVHDGAIFLGVTFIQIPQVPPFCLTNIHCNTVSFVNSNRLVLQCSRLRSHSGSNSVADTSSTGANILSMYVSVLNCQRDDSTHDSL